MQVGFLQIYKMKSSSYDNKYQFLEMNNQVPLPITEEALFFTLGALSIKGAPRRVQNRPFRVYHVIVSKSLSMGSFWS